MKLAYVSAARVPGMKAHCSQIAQMCRAFVRSGVDLKLVIPERAKSGVYKDATIEDWYGFKEKITVQRLPCLDYLGKLPRWMPHRATQKSYQLLVWSFNRSLTKYLHQQNTEFVLYSRDIHVYSSLQREFPNRKYFIELHQLEETPGQTYATEERVFGACNGIVVVTSLMQEMLISRGIDARKILVEPNAVDPETFPGSATKQDAREKLDLPQARAIVLYAGNLAGPGLDKGVGTIVDAIRSTTAQCPQALFIFVGGPDEQAEVHRKKLSKLGIRDDCYDFVGRKQYEDLNLWLAAADVLVMPTPANPDYEKVGCPLKLFEYMTAGRPMVVSDLPSVLDTVTHEHDALIFSQGEAESLSSSIVRILRSPALAERLALNVKATSKGRTWDARAARILNWVDDLRTD